ncbi:MAG: pro-sigmaK processing inhibitor BofA family protein [Acidaminococcaceae bacterium]|jgi:inhibitor of the pro-sigma K processing machinery|nr:pro-sigmaK processing inhibitor BofA family protein [Acidaminococcaceae bacterium]MCI2110099.1 pro-sigmaK processing inhibitor BofA family protein [Acidaminococcaceae bacterium]
MEFLIPAVLAVGVLFFLVNFFSLSIQFVWNGVCGVILLWAVNMISSVTGLTTLHINVGVVTSLVAGFFGVPGVILILAYQLMK